MAPIDSLTASFYDNEQYSDIVIKFGEHQIRAHKVILAQQSGYFMTAFSSRFQVASNPIIDLGDDDDPEILTDVIKYLYRRGPVHDEVSAFFFPVNVLVDIYLLADKYDIPKLRCKTALAFGKAVNRKLNPVLDPHFMEIFVDCIVKLCGPSSLELADHKLQNMITILCQQHYRLLLRDTMFLEKYKKGELFDNKNGAAFGLGLGQRLLYSEGIIPNKFVRFQRLTSIPWTYMQERAHNFYDDKKLFDVTLTWGIGYKISVHKVILAINSPYLQRILEGSPMDAEIDLGNEHDSVATAAFVEEMYTCGNSPCARPSSNDSERSIFCLAEMYLLAKRHGRDDAAQEYETRCEYVLAREHFTDELFSMVATLCGTDSTRYSNTSLPEIAFKDILYRVQCMERDGELPETFADKLEEGSLLNAAFTRRFAREMLVSFLTPEQSNVQ
ncbi:hypothetical protein KCU78_g16957, partial [Aureobasidium melanogenum]